MTELPDGWEWSTIGDVAEVNPVMSTSTLSDEDPVSFVPMASVAAESGLIDTSGVQPAGPLKKKGFRQFADGDVLVAKITPSMENGKGAVARGLASGRGFGSTEFHVLRPVAVQADFLLRFVLQHSFRAAAAQNMTGTAGQLRVPPGYLRNHPIPVPPLPEQIRIVVAIEEYFSRLNAAEASLTAALTRASRLADVACAALTDGDWPLEPLSDLLISLRNGVFVSRPSADPPGEPILRISAVRPRRLDVEDVRFVDPLPDRADDYRIEPDDVLFTRYSGNPKYVGACAVVPPSASGVLHPDKLIRGVVDKAKADPRWISAYVSVGRGRSEIEARLKTTAGQVGISGGQLKTVPVATPSPEEQRRRCDEIDRFAELAEWSSSAIRSARSRSSSLRRSILAAAFSGQLVLQDPTDEPASVLLERIAGERAALKPSPRKKPAS